MAIATLLPALLPGCASRTPEMYRPGYCVIVCPAPQDPGTERSVREAFERWNANAARGDARACFSGISNRLKSQWLWDRIDDNRDLITRLHLQGLDAERQTALDDWHRGSPASRVHIAPPDTLQSQWLGDLWRDHFNRDRSAIMVHAAKRVVRCVYADRDGATIIANALGVRELYGMVRDDGAWRVDSRR